MPRCHESASDTAGLKCAPETGPNVRISATNAAPVAIVFASKAIATFPPASRSPMIPEPTTAIRRKAVPTNSAVIRARRLNLIGDLYHPVPSSGLACRSTHEEAKGKDRFVYPIEGKLPGKHFVPLP